MRLLTRLSVESSLQGWELVGVLVFIKLRQTYVDVAVCDGRNFLRNGMRTGDSVSLYEPISNPTFFLGGDHDDQKQNLTQGDELWAEFVNPCGQLVGRVVLNELISELSKYLKNLQEKEFMQKRNQL